MNAFDAVIYAIAIGAIVIGFSVGLLRSLAAILAYLIAAPLAAGLLPHINALVHATPSDEQDWLIFFIIFVAVGIGINALLRIIVSECVGRDIGWPDRLAGACLGGIRIGLVAVLVVAVFDRLVPPDREPWFLVGSHLRPYLSAAGQIGLRSLPPEVDDYIERLKQERGLT